MTSTEASDINIDMVCMTVQGSTANIEPDDLVFSLYIVH